MPEDMKPMKKRPKIGVGVIVIKENKVLLGKRLNSHGKGTWSFLGGHLEFNETPEDCARREAMEEANIRIKNVKFATITNDIFSPERKHYITIFMKSEYDSGGVKIKEPDKFQEIGWFEWNNLPKPLFLPIQNLFKQGYDPFGE